MNERLLSVGVLCRHYWSLKYWRIIRVDPAEFTLEPVNYDQQPNRAKGTIRRTELQLRSDPWLAGASPLIGGVEVATDETQAEALAEAHKEEASR